MLICMVTTSSTPVPSLACPAAAVDANAVSYMATWAELLAAPMDFIIPQLIQSLAIGTFLVWFTKRPHSAAAHAAAD